MCLRILVHSWESCYCTPMIINWTPKLWVSWIISNVTTLFHSRYWSRVLKFLRRSMDAAWNGNKSCHSHANTHVLFLSRARTPSQALTHSFLTSASPISSQWLSFVNLIGNSLYYLYGRIVWPSSVQVQSCFISNKLFYWLQPPYLVPCS